ncbi:YadA C-terminal domain-containing protein [Gallibacterium anatis]|uniref:YadA C-terminal domain-containing protein n=1 Tax=Gallibacterium anatis TaxID=750 RepID=UPI003003E8E9
MLIKLDRSFFMYLTLMLSISFNVFAKDESSGDEIVPADDCAPCERLDLIDAILGVNTWEKVSNYSDKQSDFYKDVVLNSIPGEEGNDPDAVAKMKEFIKGNTIIGTLESGIETNKTSITDNTSAIKANKTAITNNTSAIEANKTAITNNTSAIEANKTAITNNTSAIEANKTAITNNTSAIDANKTAITNNTNTINTNRIAITNNTNAINANRTVIENHEDRIQQLESRKLNLDKQINQLHRDIKSLDDRLASGIAASNAMAGLVSATKDGKSMIAVGLGTYRDRSAIAIGISRLSDNGRWKAKFSFATGMNGSNKDLSTSTSIGYQF